MISTKINALDIKDESRTLLLAIIQQAVEDIKRSAKLYEYYFGMAPTSQYKTYDNRDVWLYYDFILSGKNAIESVQHSIVIDLSFRMLDNAYNFWIECLNRIENDNKNWSQYYAKEIKELKKELERIKI